MRELRFEAEIRFTGYGQVFQELLDPSGLFARNAGGINIALVRFDDWPDGRAAEFAQTVRATALPAPLIVVLCPGRQDCTGVVRPALAGLPGVHVITAAQIEVGRASGRGRV